MTGRFGSVLAVLLLLFAMLAPVSAMAVEACCPHHEPCAAMAQIAPAHVAVDQMGIRSNGDDDRHHRNQCPACCLMTGCSSVPLLLLDPELTPNQPGLRTTAYPLLPLSEGSGHTGRPAVPPPRILS